MTENGNFDVMRTSDMKRILHMIELPVSFFADIFVCRINAIEAKMQQTNGRKEETLDAMRKKQYDLEKLQKSLDFFESQVEAVRTGTIPVECPVCLEEIPDGFAVITTCSHVYCATCVEKLIASSGQCGTCRQTLTARSYRIIESAAALNSMSSSSQNQQVLAQFGQFGSKLAYVFDRLMKIKQEDPKAKVLIYCQFDNLLQRL